VLDQLLQVFGQLTLRECAMDCEPGAIEANCRISLQASEGTPVMVWLSRNRYLSNTMVFDFEHAQCSAALHKEEIVVRPADAAPYRIGPLGEPVGFERALDRIYLQGLKKQNNVGFTPQDSLLHLELIEAAYATATPLDSEEWF